jgi:hypothetical protein
MRTVVVACECRSVAEVLAAGLPCACRFRQSGRCVVSSREVRQADVCLVLVVLVKVHDGWCWWAVVRVGCDGEGRSSSLRRSRCSFVARYRSPVLVAS